MEFFVQPNGSLFKLTKGEFDFIMDIIREENPVKPARLYYHKVHQPILKKYNRLLGTCKKAAGAGCTYLL